MASLRRIAGARFWYSLVHLEQRTVLLATCKKCGEAQTCSTWDGTLQRWQRWHRCDGIRLLTASPCRPHLKDGGFRAR